MPEPWTRIADGIVVAVRVTPRGGRDRLGGSGGGDGEGTWLAARIAAPPADGKANMALIALVAAAFGVPKRAVAIVAGDTARRKRLRITGDPVALAKIAHSLYAGEP